MLLIKGVDMHLSSLRTSLLKRYPTHSSIRRSPAGLTPAPDPLPENAYLKRPYLLNYGATDNCCTILIQEANIHEKLRLNPHKNIVRYYGCVAENVMFHAIRLERYPATLQDRGRICLRLKRSG